MATFHIINFGCRASQADGSALKQQLLQAGLQEATSVDESQVAILNTCTVTATADAEVRQFVRRIHRRNPHCRILVTGCYAQRAPGEVARLEGVAWVVGNSHKHLVSTLVNQPRAAAENAAKSLSASPAVQIQAAPASGVHDLINSLDSALDPGLLPAPASASGPAGRTHDAVQVLVGEITEEFHFAPVFPDDRTRPTLKIQDGCNARCSFCVIPSVRGRSRSLEPEKVLAEVRRLEEAGYQEVVLSGINLGSYGRDLDRRTNFLGILERILRESSIPRIRISSVEAMDVSVALIRLVAQEPRLAQHFHVPLQSGCDRILRLMNRRYWARQYAERILAIREQIPDCGIGADVMVGFPGETDQEHSTSLRFIASLPFTYLHIFPYSTRPGTPAAAGTGQVNGRVARERSQEIRAAMAAKREAFLAAQVGRSIPGLTLDEVEEGARVALTTNYLNVALPGSEVPANKLVDVWVGRTSSGQLFGYPHGAGVGSAALPLEEPSKVES
ncbi:MAG: tRNA (N(6)-L-threonylcarbamoyladenosine(37)-C(2))-methylthiotransferase MtaB [Acidobacteriia bacterium]|nr:tRNA (N(6)-L-threonylcarbamoyladenosine(37)-C(2))-methylthiotransferase MtaB [Terriglobia bacterium]